MLLRSTVIFIGCLSIIGITLIQSLHAQQPQEKMIFRFESILIQRYLDQSPKEKVAVLDSVVNLTDQQQNQFLNRYSEIADSVQTIGINFLDEFDEEDEFSRILTEEQLLIWEAYNLQKSIDRRMNQIDRVVTLSDDQRAEILPVIQKEIIAFNTISAQLRSTDKKTDVSSLLKQRIAIHKETLQMMSTILTQQQRFVFNTILHEY